jgi:hypothetical protein
LEKNNSNKLGDPTFFAKENKIINQTLTVTQD